MLKEPQTVPVKKIVRTPRNSHLVVVSTPAGLMSFLVGPATAAKARAVCARRLHGQLVALGLHREAALLAKEEQAYAA